MATYRERASRFRDVSLVIPLIFGIVFFLTSGSTVLDAQRIVWNGAAQAGTVIAVERNPGMRSTYTVVYRFRDRKGQSFTARQQAKVPWRPARVGDTVPVLYDIDDPRRSIINTYWGRFIDIALALLSLGLAAYCARKLMKNGWTQRRF